MATTYEYARLSLTVNRSTNGVSELEIDPPTLVPPTGLRTDGDTTDVGVLNAFGAEGWRLIDYRSDLDNPTRGDSDAPPKVTVLVMKTRH